MMTTIIILCSIILLLLITTLKYMTAKMYVINIKEYHEYKAHNVYWTHSKRDAINWMKDNPISEINQYELECLTDLSKNTYNCIGELDNNMYLRSEGVLKWVQRRLQVVTDKSGIVFRIAYHYVESETILFEAINTTDFNIENLLIEFDKEFDKTFPNTDLLEVDENSLCEINPNIHRKIVMTKLR